jgi:hypothetical protein
MEGTLVSPRSCQPQAETNRVKSTVVMAAITFMQTSWGKWRLCVFKLMAGAG